MHLAENCRLLILGTELRLIILFFRDTGLKAAISEGSRWTDVVSTWDPRSRICT